MSKSLNKHERLSQFSVSATDSMKRRLKIAATAQKRTLAGYCRIAIEEALDRDLGPAPKARVAR